MRPDTEIKIIKVKQYINYKNINLKGDFHLVILIAKPAFKIDIWMFLRPVS